MNKPTPIQQRVILPILEGRDVIAQSQSGTGKSTIFCIAVLQMIDTSSSSLQAMVVSPTRELAEQLSTNLKAIGSYLNAKVG